MTIDLQEFCAKGDPREWLGRPFDAAGGVGATDGNLLVWMHGEPVGHGPDAQADIDMAEKLIASVKAAADMGARLAWSDPKVAHLVEVECTWCDGTGVQDGECDECDGGEFMHGTHFYDCKECDGSGSTGSPGRCEMCVGTKLEAAASSIGNHETCISSVYVARLRELPGCMVTSLPDEGRNFYFRFDGGVGMVAGFLSAAIQAEEAA